MHPRPTLSLLALAALAALGERCSTPAAPAADAGTAPTDLGNPVDTGVPPPWPHELPRATVMGEARGWRAMRAIVHAHSVHSHDACDGRPYVDGGVNEPCLQSFRRAVCATRIDVMFLTEHAGLMATVPFETVLQSRPGDELVRENGALVGYRIACPNGHRTLLLPGAENELMPLALTRHPDPVNGSLASAYNARDPAAARRFREAGALVAIPHAEQRTLAHIRAIEPEVMELYNVHTNLDPRLASMWLGINTGPSLGDVVRFAQNPDLDPEWVFLAFVQENPTDLRHWATLLSEGRHITGVAASDAHENALPMLLRDGERGDSYRRVFRFFSNQLMVRGEPTRANVVEALARGRVFVTFEAFGTPSGFAFTARGSDGTVREMGETVSIAAAPVLTVTAPTVYELPRGLPTPRVRVRLLQAMSNGEWRELMNDATGAALSYTPTAPGVFRAEARITPEHARPYIPGMERIVHEVQWVYSNPIYVER